MTTMAEPGLACAGRHLLIDLHGAARLDELDFIRDTCIAAAKATGATVIGENFHGFGEGFGVTGVVILAESHLSIHTWPESGYAAVDVFVCGDCVPEAAIAVLEAAFLPAERTLALHRRGVGVTWTKPGALAA